MKKIILTKGHLNKMVEKMIKEDALSGGGYDSPDRKAKFRSDIEDEMAEAFDITVKGLSKMAEQIGKLEIERPLHNELKKRLFMIDKHLRPIAQAMEDFQKETGDADFRDPEDFDITQISSNE